MRVIALIALCIAAVSAVPENPQRIVGGSVTTIGQYPSIAALLYTRDWSSYWQDCGGTILNNRSILTAAHCIEDDPANRWRVRVGSSWANSGGVVHITATIIEHHNYDWTTRNNDIAVLRTATTIAQNNNVRPASIAGTNYNIAENQVVWAAGWGYIAMDGPSSEQLRHVQIWTINQNTCRDVYATRGQMINENMLCSGAPGDSRDQCQGDSGGPLYHNGVVVGVFSFSIGCGLSEYPAVNTRVSRYTSWIQSNA